MPLDGLVKRNNVLHAKSDARTLLAHALDDPRLGETAVVSSFGAESVVLLHLIAQIDPATPVLFLDTEMLFAETLSYQAQVASALGLSDVRIIRPARASLFEHDNEGLLHQHDADACCNLRKSVPLAQALAPFGSWITGRKRVQSETRTTLPLFEMDAGRIKINPLAGWSREQIGTYMDRYDLPRHPLVAKGFPSIGCAPCTSPVGHGEDQRAGRWRNQEKTECGIHFENGKLVRPGLDTTQ